MIDDNFNTNPRNALSSVMSTIEEYNKGYCKQDIHVINVALGSAQAVKMAYDGERFYWRPAKKSNAIMRLEADPQAIRMLDKNEVILVDGSYSEEHLSRFDRSGYEKPEFSQADGILSKLGL